MSEERQITRYEELIIKDLEHTTNLTRDEAKGIAFNCFQYGYIVHKHDFELLENDRNHLRVKVDNLVNELQKAKEENKKLKEKIDESVSVEKVMVEEKKMENNIIREMCCFEMKRCEHCILRELCEIVSIQDDEMPFGDIIDKLNEVMKDINEEMED